MACLIRAMVIATGTIWPFDMMSLMSAALTDSFPISLSSVYLSSQQVAGRQVNETEFLDESCAERSFA